MQQNRIGKIEIAVRVDIAGERCCLHELQSAGRQRVFVVKPDRRVFACGGRIPATQIVGFVSVPAEVCSISSVLIENAVPTPEPA